MTLPGMRPRRHLSLRLALVVGSMTSLGAACGDEDGASPDAGTITDAGSARDAEAPAQDGGVDDLGRVDAGQPDAGAQDAAAARFSIAGTVTGLEGQGLVLVLRVDGSEERLEVSSDSFAFPNPLEDGAAYELDVGSQPIAPVQACRVENGSGTIMSADVALEVRCVTPSTRFVVTGNGARFFVNAVDAFGWARAWRRIDLPDAGVQAELVAHPTEPWLYRQANGAIVTWAVASDGRLTVTSTLATPSRRSLALRIAPSGRRAFSLVNEVGTGVVSTLDIGPSGELTRTSTNPASFPGLPLDMVLDPRGRFLWGLGFSPPMSAVHPFSIDASGGLTPLPSTSVPTGFAALAYAPSAEVMVVAGNDGSLYQFRVGTDGLLTPLSPPSLPVGSPGAYDVVVEPSGRFAYVSSRVDERVSAFSIAPEGLTATGTVAAEGQPGRLYADPSGRFVAVVHFGPSADAVARFRIGADGGLTFHDIGPAAETGSLALVRGAPLEVDSERLFIQVRPDGLPLEHRLRRYEIDAQGQLTLAGEVETGTGNLELGVVVDPPGENVYATAFLPNDQERLAHLDARGGGLTPVSPDIEPFDVATPWLAFSPRGNVHLERRALLVAQRDQPRQTIPRTDGYGANTPPVFDPSGRWAWIRDGMRFGPTPAFLDIALGSEVQSPLLSGFIDRLVPSPNGRFGWSARFGFFAVAIDIETGAISEASSPPQPPNASAVAVHPSGRFVFVAGLQEITSFSVASDGALTQVGTAMSPNAEFDRRLAVSPSGRFLYAMAFGAGAQLNQFAIEPDGTLTPLSPFSIPMWTDSVAASATWR